MLLYEDQGCEIRREGDFLLFGERKKRGVFIATAVFALLGFISGMNAFVQLILSFQIDPLFRQSLLGFILFGLSLLSFLWARFFYKKYKYLAQTPLEKVAEILYFHLRGKTLQSPPGKIIASEKISTQIRLSPLNLVRGNFGLLRSLVLYWPNGKRTVLRSYDSSLLEKAQNDLTAFGIQKSGNPS